MAMSEKDYASSLCLLHRFSDSTDTPVSLRLISLTKPCAKKGHI